MMTACGINSEWVNHNLDKMHSEWLRFDDWNDESN